MAPVKAPMIPQDYKFNTVNSYRRTLDVPADWAARRVLITFEGVNSFFYLWINGQAVGFSKDSRTRAEFDVTKHVNPGKNSLAVENFRWCDGSYLEDQDFWRMSGIFRDVYLWSAPLQHIRDFEVKTELDAACLNAGLKVSLQLNNAGKAASGLTVEASLADHKGMVSTMTSKPAVVAPGAEATVELSAKVDHPRKWSAEDPYLYAMLITLKDGQGKPWR